MKFFIILLPSPFKSMKDIHLELKEELQEEGWNEWTIIDSMIVYFLSLACFFDFVVENVIS